MAAIVTTVSALVGLLTGSFSNVAIHRWPRDGSVREPSRSACPTCDNEIAARDNVPVVSWLLLRGSCRHCGEPISRRYPLVELLTGVLFAAVATVRGPSWFLVAALPFTWALVVATMIDLEHRRIPNVLTYRLAPAMALLLLVPTLLGEGSLGQAQWGDYRRAWIYGLVLPGAMFAIGELYRLLRGRFGIGMGDVKLAASLGLVTGWLGGWEVVVLVYTAVISAFVVAVTLIAAGRAKLASAIPYGPYLALGAIAVLLAGDELVALLQGLLLP